MSLILFAIANVITFVIGVIAGAILVKRDQWRKEQQQIKEMVRILEKIKDMPSQINFTEPKCHNEENN